jgi:outer membrane scaffolding protein for murein synthesis (MipA/OmpV family)
MFFQSKLVNGVCFLMAVLMCQTVWSDELDKEEDDLGWKLGLGTGVAQSIYKGVDDDEELFFLPIVEYSGSWYSVSLQGVEVENVLRRSNGQEVSFKAGLTFGLGDEPAGFELGIGTSLISRENLVIYISSDIVISIDEESRSEDDSYIFKGMDERVVDTDKFLLNLELQSVYGAFSLGVESDISDTYEGSTFDVKYSVPLVDNDKAGLWVGTGVEFYDSNYVDYYYGVKSNETTVERPFYAGENASSPYIGYSFLYQYTKQWNISHELRVRKVSDEILESPLTEDDDIAVDGLISIAYMFCNGSCKE